METVVQTRSAYLSHDEHPVALEQAVRDIRDRIHAEGDQPGATVARQLRVVDDLLRFGLGRYLLVHQGYNGYWTRYIAGLQPGCGLAAGVNDEGNPLSDLEQWILQHSPGAYIVRERMRTAQAILQPLLRDGVVFASLPCGAMDDLLGLRPFAPKGSGGIETFRGAHGVASKRGAASGDSETFREDAYPNARLVGIDVDPDALRLAEQNARERGLARYTEFVQADAWHLGITDRFDAMVCHGLLSYVRDLQRVRELYARFHRALKPGGILITCFVPPSPTENPNSPWNVARIGQENLQRYDLVYRHVLRPKWGGNHRTQQQVTGVLRGAGFAKVQLRPDDWGLCITAVATK
ncbi:MAG: class I SAM-dependent methyltransferase [Myxococcota bacterium]